MHVVDPCSRLIVFNAEYIDVLICRCYHSAFAVKVFCEKVFMFYLLCFEKSLFFCQRLHLVHQRFTKVACVSTKYLSNFIYLC